MTSGAPQVELNTGNYPNLDPSAPSNASNVNGTVQDAKNSVYSNAQSAMDSVANHPVTQNVKDTINNGPVAQNIKDEAGKTQSEFSNLASARKTPDQKAATGQELTHYHSMFYSLLSWENPRATAVSFVTTILCIFAARYVPVLRYAFKGLYIVLGAVAAAEVAGKAILNKGLVSQMRPKKYYVIPRESLEAMLEDVEQLINFFVIEFQRILFAENVYATVAAFTVTLISYFLVKFVPKWGLALIGTSVLYLAPLIYLQNREAIDAQLRNIGNIVNQQTAQVKDMAAQTSSRAAETVKATAHQYTEKAQEMMGHAKQRAASPSAPNPGNMNPMKNEPEREVHRDDFKNMAASGSAPNPGNVNPFKNEPGREFSNSDFPSAPKREPLNAHSTFDQSTYGQTTYGQTNYDQAEIGRAEPQFQ
ncbi:hypothetical protein B0A49_10126 [Cryomyces minteri]|uniref:Reticulon-like protein n=1 Tax=Cryomyces minteri TaxID=331657 RepID=A0A4V5NFF1_9PEZI|nr:hypothetical protein B0A49_10126 [Cryomyces minteri]